MSWCADKGYLPLFFEFAGHENYYKLLYDFNVYDNVTDEYAPQEAVTTTYPTAEGEGANIIDDGFDATYFKDTLDGYMAWQNEYNERLDSKLDEIADRFVNTDGLKYSGRSFAEQVDEVKVGKFKRGNAVYVGKTVDFAVKIGLDRSLPMLTTATHISNAMKPKNVRLHHHGLTIEQVKSIPQKMNDPVMVFDSNTDNNSVVFVTDMLDTDGSPIVVSVKANGDGTINNVQIDTNFITGFYGRDWFSRFVETTVKKDNVLYINKKKAIALEAESSSRWLEQLKGYDFDAIIRQTKANVNSLNEKYSYDDVKHSVRVDDKQTLDFLNKQKTVTTYKTMQLVDGKLYPPMASRINGKYEDASELGVWEEAVEHPDLVDKNGKFKLDKGKGNGSITAAYNPYMHSSNLVINDQFSGAYARDNLVTVECEVPVSEETSNYKADGAKDSVGWHSWHTGTVASKLRKNGGEERRVFLSRWIKPVRIVPDAEVAKMVKDLIGDADISIPDNVVTPSLLDALKAEGVSIEESGRVKRSVRDYSYDAFVSKPDMVVTTVGDNVPTNRADVIAVAKKKASEIGKLNPKSGSVSVRVKDIDTDVVLSTKGLRHSIDRRFSVNAPVVVEAGRILQNSIRINELSPRREDVKGTYVLLGVARNEQGEVYVVRSVVNEFQRDLVSMDVLYAINAKQESKMDKEKNRSGDYPQGFADETSDSLSGSTISIAEFLEIVNRYFPDVLAEDVLKHFGHESRPNGDLSEDILYSTRDTSSVSSRWILSNALESVAVNDAERKKRACLR